MGDRYTKKDAERAMERLAGVLGKPLGHYRHIDPGEVSNMGADREYTTVPGGWALDYNPIYGGCVIEELSPNPGETWISHPCGSMRLSPRDFCRMVDDMIRGHNMAQGRA